MTLTWLVVPVLVLFMISFIEPLFLPRYLVYTIGNRLGVRAGAAVVVGVFSVVALLAYYKGQIADFRGAAEYVHESEHARDAVVLGDALDCATTWRAANAQAAIAPTLPLGYPTAGARFGSILRRRR